MTGMKEGAGENPFAEDETSPESDSADRDTDERTQSSRETTATSVNQESRRESRRHVDIPYKFRRDGVQDGRNRVPLFLQEESKNAERDALRELEERFGDDVSLTDLREAVMIVGLDHLDEVESQLEQWGYGITFDE